jgi:hypothetical protein
MNDCTNTKDVSLNQMISPYLLEVITKFEFALLLRNVRFNFGVSIIDNSQEHVEQHKEHEEDVCDEECWAENTVGILNLMEVKVTKDDTEQGESIEESIKNIYVSKSEKSFIKTLFLILYHMKIRKIVQYKIYMICKLSL